MQDVGAHARRAGQYDRLAWLQRVDLLVGQAHERRVSERRAAHAAADPADCQGLDVPERRRLRRDRSEGRAARRSGLTAAAEEVKGQERRAKKECRRNADDNHAPLALRRRIDPTGCQVIVVGRAGRDGAVVELDKLALEPHQRVSVREDAAVQLVVDTLNEPLHHLLDVRRGRAGGPGRRLGITLGGLAALLQNHRQFLARRGVELGFAYRRRGVERRRQIVDARLVRLALCQLVFFLGDEGAPVAPGGLQRAQNLRLRQLGRGS